MLRSVTPVVKQVACYPDLPRKPCDVVASALTDVNDLAGLEARFASLVEPLAFADVLRENRQPATVILDDAIVFADDDRFTRMIHILRKAAEKTKILIFTCRERDYLAARAPTLKLADCRA